MKKVSLGVSLVLLAASLSFGQEESLAARVLDRYQAADRAGADRLLATHADALTFDRLGSKRGAILSAVFKSRAAGLTIRIERSETKRPLKVALPPGILAKPRVEKGPRHDPLPQDLLLIRPAFLSLAPGQKQAEVTLPVACAAFRRDGPQPGVVYTLLQLPANSKLDRLALSLCSRKAVPKSLDPALALAVWIAHEDLGYQRLAGSSLGFRTFRTPRQRVGAEHGPAAAALLHEAGLDLDAFDFYRAGGSKARGAVPLKAPKGFGEGKGKPGKGDPKPSAKKPSVQP